MVQYTDEQMKEFLARVGPGSGRQLIYSPSDGSTVIDNPNYRVAETRGPNASPTMHVPVQSWESTDGYKIKAYRKPDGNWEVVNDNPPVATGGQTPDQAAITAATAETARRQRQERERNAQNGGQYETDEDKRAREAKERSEERQRALDQEARDERDRVAARQAGLDARAISAQEASNTLGTGQLDVARSAEARQQRSADQPNVLSRPDDTTANIALFNPVTGQIETQKNPLYDQAKADAQRLKDELTLAIQLNKMTADQAATEYQRWFKENVEVPFLVSAEERARAAEQRAALDSEERRRQFSATHELQRAELGQRAGATAIGAEMQMLPYRVGPGFDQHMGEAINSLAGGGSMGANASAGIHFSPGDFSFDKPNLSKIAAKATAQALKGLSPYIPADGQYQTAQYSGSMPTAGVMAGAPVAPPGLDLTGAFNQLTGGRYAGPAAPAPPPPLPPEEPT